MKKLLVILIIAVFACKKEDSAMPTVVLGNKIEATYNNEGEYQQNVKIKITNIEESRCPKNVTCIWAGSVKVYLILSQSGISKDFVLEFLADNSKPANATVKLGNQNYFVEISDVLPYPQNVGEIKLKDYKVSLTVKKI